MIETDPDLRAVEATLFASDQPMTVEQIRGYVVHSFPSRRSSDHRKSVV